MRDAAFRDTQLAGLDATHVAPVNALLAGLAGREGRGDTPRVVPLHGGTGSLLLVLVAEPEESGLLCVENDTDAAAELAEAFAGLGIPPSVTTVWPADPWAGGDVTAGVDPLLRLVDLLGELQLVLLCGRSAATAWEQAVRRRPYLERSVATVTTSAPGTPDGLAERRTAYTEVQQLLWTL